MIQLTCPITLFPFIEPLFLECDQFTYEKSALLEWFKGKQSLSPMGFPLTSDKYVTTPCSFLL